MQRWKIIEIMNKPTNSALLETLENNWIRLRERKTGAGSGDEAPVPLEID